MSDSPSTPHDASNSPVTAGSGGKPRKVLSLFDSVCIIVGIIIGSGIFETGPRVAAQAGNATWTIGFWVLGGLLALIGALCFAELTTRYKDEVGGDYVYLKKSIGGHGGRSIAFLFAWASFWIIRPANIGAMAMVFARYFGQILPVQVVLPWLGESPIPYAVMAVVVLSVANLVGLRQGKLVQNVLSVSKVVGIGAVIAIAFMAGDPASVPQAEIVRPEFGAIWLAMIFVMFTYGGWNDVAFVAGEVREPQKNLLRSLVLGTLTVMMLYVLINTAFLVGLGFDKVVGSEAVATDLVRQCLGETTWLGQTSGKLISGLVCIACLGAINGMIIVGPRIYYALGRDFRAFAPLARWSEKRDSPWQGTLAQGVISVVLILVCLEYADAFDVIVTVAAPYFWGFLGMTVLCLLLLRYRKIDPEGDYFRVPLFPVLPLMFAAICFCLVYAGIDYLVFKGYQNAAFVLMGFMGIGIVLSFFLKSTDSD